MTIEEYTFQEGDFDPDLVGDPEVLNKLKEVCVGKPVFAPEPGMEHCREWNTHVVAELGSSPSLSSAILNGSLPLRGQNLTALGPRLPVGKNQEQMQGHLFDDEESCLESYAVPWFSKNDFPSTKPCWSPIPDQCYKDLLNFFTYPIYLGDRLDEEVYPGYYNLKHEIVHGYMFTFQL